MTPVYELQKYLSYITLTTIVILKKGSSKNFLCTIFETQFHHELAHRPTNAG